MSSAFEYQLSALGRLNSQGLGGSARRPLHHKTVVQLLVEDAMLNMNVEIGGIELELPKPSQNMVGEVRGFMKRVLDELMGERFGYRLSVRTSPVKPGFVRVRFESEIKNLGNARRKLCSNRITATLPLTPEELAQRVKEVLGIDLELKPSPAAEINLELWSA